MAIGGPSLIRRYGEPVVLGRALPEPELITDGLIAKFMGLQGANAAVYYDDLETYDGQKPAPFHGDCTWITEGLQFPGTIQFPTELATALEGGTDMWVVRLPDEPYGYSSITSKWILLSDGRFCSGSTGSLTFSPNELWTGDVVLTMTYGDTTKLYFNTREAGDLGYANSTNVTPAGQTKFGYHELSGFTGRLYMRLCWDFVLTPAQVRSQVRWAKLQMAGRGITIGPSTSDGIPIIACIGDSLTSGYPGALGQDWPLKVRNRLDTPCQLLNYGSNGMYLSTMAGLVDNRVEAMFAASQNVPRVVIFGGGTNELYQGGRNSAGLISAAADCVTNARAAGADYVIIRTIPWGKWTALGNQATGEATVIAANEGFLANAFGADAIADTTEDPLIGHGADYDDTDVYFGDGVHLLPPGQDSMSDAIEIALAEVGIT